MRQQDSPVNLVNALVERCRRGDADAFDLLVEQYQTRIYNLCLWQLGDRDEAADATQETFIRAWRSIRKFRGDCAFSTWLHRIAINVTNDLSSKRKAAPATFTSLATADTDTPDDYDERMPDPAAGPAEAALIAEKRRLVGAALRDMSAEHRIVLVLFDIEGHSYDEVAATLQLPMGTVKSRLNRARQALRRLLEPCRELFED